MSADQTITLKTGTSKSPDDLKTAVVLLQYGGPDSQEAVAPFLFNLFNDPNIIEAPTPIRWMIAKFATWKRTPIAKEIYREMGGGSPILSNTVAQQVALDDMLNSGQMGLGQVKSFIAMRYWNPLSEVAAQQIKDWNPDRIVLLPLYPQYSRATTGSSVRVWEQACEKVGLRDDIPTWTICCYPDDGGFVDTVARLTKTMVEKARNEHPDHNPYVIFSAHGLPERNIKKGDPYQMQNERSVEAIRKRMDELGVDNLDSVLSYQSRVGPLKWITPDTEKEVEQASEAGRSIILVPIAFVSEHSETLVELDIEYRELAEEHGANAYYRAPTVDARTAFLDGLATQVQRALGDKPKVCSANGTRICPRKWGRCPADVELIKEAA